jgi:hypothetical protein
MSISFRLATCLSIETRRVPVGISIGVFPNISVLSCDYSLKLLQRLGGSHYPGGKPMFPDYRHNGCLAYE